MDLLDCMLDHDAWAASQLLAHAATLTDAQLDQPFDLGHGSLRATISHQSGALAFWLPYITSQPVPAPEPDPSSSIAELTKYFNALHAVFAATAREVRDQNRLAETFTGPTGHPSSYGATILHILHHSAQHRAEEQHMLQRLGVSDVWDYDPQEWEWSLR